MTTIVITGAAGNYGRLAIEGLLNRGIAPSNLVLMSRTPGKLAQFADRGLTIRRGDFDDPESLRSAFAGGDQLLLISTGRVGQRIEQHGSAIKAAVDAGISHIVYTSFIGAGGSSPALVVKDHTGTEQLLRASGVAWTALRDSQYSEAMVEAAAPLMLSTGRWQVAAADGKIGFVTRRDCVACAVAVLTTPGHRNRAYDITGPELLSFRDVAALTAEVGGRAVDFTVVDDEGLYEMFDALGIPRQPVDDQIVQRFPWCSDDMVSFERSVREGYMAVLSNDVESLTGKKPQSLRSFFLEHREFLRALVPSRI